MNILFIDTILSMT